MKCALRDVKMLIGFYAVTLVIQLVGASITQTSVHDWYPLLKKSTLTPPGYVFGIVWTLLYILMAVAAWRIWRIERTLNSAALRIWLMQLVTGLLWTSTFFGMIMTQEGLVIIACLWMLILLTLKRFVAIDRLAAGLMVPLLLWVSFATYLNAMIVHLN